MGKSGIALLLKFVITFLFSIVAFIFMEGNLWTWVLALSAIVTIANYQLGDMVILPVFGNIIASIGDGLMAAIIALVMSFFVAPFQITLIAVAVYGVLIAVGEFFFHKYLTNTDTVKLD